MDANIITPSVEEASGSEPTKMRLVKMSSTQENTNVD